ncbi:MAG TPA: hypothetical protein V6C65_40125, partial [Allocoleopsis sp.]
VPLLQEAIDKTLFPFRTWQLAVPIVLGVNLSKLDRLQRRFCPQLRSDHQTQATVGGFDCERCFPDSPASSIYAALDLLEDSQGNFARAAEGGFRSGGCFGGNQRGERLVEGNGAVVRCDLIVHSTSAS